MIEQSRSAAGRFQISSDPITSPSSASESMDSPGQLPGSGRKNLLLALPRNRNELFVCWSVDWLAFFADAPPFDRQAHVRIRCESEKQITRAVEPMSGSCIMADLEPGQTYVVELGYYAPAVSWNVVARVEDVTMPPRGRSADESCDLVTIPLYLSFERIQRLLEADPDSLAVSLAQFERRALHGDTSDAEKDILRDVGLAASDLECMDERALWLASRPPAAQSSNFSGSSWSADS